MINYIPRRFTIVRDRELCIDCGCCVRQCSNECHSFGPDGKTVVSHSQDCVACHRCVDLCPTGALRIEKYVCDYRDNPYWTPRYQQEICRQANTGGVLLSAMGNPQPYPIYWAHAGEEIRMRVGCVPADFLRHFRLSEGSGSQSDD